MAEATPATTLTAWDDALKQYYIDKKPIDVAYNDHPFLTMIPKNTRFRGKNMPLPIIYARPQGRSATFATAQSNATSSSLGEFLLTRVKNYGVVTVDGETIEASKGNEYAFLEALTTETDLGLKTLGDTLSRQMFRSQSGSIGVVGATPADTAVLDLATDADSLNFEVGMKIVFTDSTSTGSLRDSGEALTVTSVSRMAASNQIGVSPNLTTIASVASGDFVVPEGDLVTPGTYLVMAGLQDWIPASAPGSTAFFGQDRSSDPTRLGGQRVAYSSTREETIINGLGRAAREGGQPDHIFVSFTDFIALEKELESTVQREVDPETGAGFRSMEMYAPYGVAKIIPDKDCPVGVAYALQMDTWQLATIGETVGIIDADGNRILRQSSADGVEVRVGFYGQLACSAPGFNVRIALS